MDPKQTRNNGGNRMEARITSVQYNQPRRLNPDAISESIVRIMLLVGIGAVLLVFVGIVFISSAV